MEQERHPISDILRVVDPLWCWLDFLMSNFAMFFQTENCDKFVQSIF